MPCVELNVRARCSNLAAASQRVRAKRTGTAARRRAQPHEDIQAAETGTLSDWRHTIFTRSLSNRMTTPSTFTIGFPIPGNTSIRSIILSISAPRHPMLSFASQARRNDSLTVRDSVRRGPTSHAHSHRPNRQVGVAARPGGQEAASACHRLVRHP